MIITIFLMDGEEVTINRFEKEKENTIHNIHFTNPTVQFEMHF